MRELWTMINSVKTMEQLNNARAIIKGLKGELYNEMLIALNVIEREII